MIKYELSGWINTTVVELLMVVELSALHQGEICEKWHFSKTFKGCSGRQKNFSENDFLFAEFPGKFLSRYLVRYQMSKSGFEIFGNVSSFESIARINRFLHIIQVYSIMQDRMINLINYFTNNSFPHSTIILVSCNRCSKEEGMFSTFYLKSWPRWFDILVGCGCNIVNFANFSTNNINFNGQWLSITRKKW